MNQENILFICRNENDLRRASEISKKGNQKFILATNDILIHKKISDFPFIDEVSFIETDESFFSVVHDVTNLTSHINKWLYSLAEKEEKSEGLMHWVRQAEGGMTTQRLQDLFMLINNYIKLLEKNNVKEVYLSCSLLNQWEDSILIETASTKNIKVHTRNSYLSSLSFQILYMTVLSVILESYSLLRTVCLISLYTFKKKTESISSVIIQLCSSAPKHIVQHLPLLNSLKREGRSTTVLCWKAHRGAVKFSKAGFNVVELEGQLNYKDIVTSILATYYMFRKAVNSWKEFRFQEFFRYNSIEISRFIWPSFISFFLSEFGQRKRLLIAGKKYFSNGIPLVIKYWTLIFPEAVILRELLSDKNVKSFHWAGPAYIYKNNPYEHFIINPDLVFASDKKQAEQLTEMGFESSKIKIVGEIYKYNITEYAKTTDTHSARKRLSLSNKYNYHIFYDPGLLLRGYLSIKEQVMISETLFEIAEKNQDTALIIKPHPGHKTGTLEYLMRHFSLKNVYKLRRKDLPYDAIISSDVVITKYSTIGLESLSIEKPVIAPIISGDKRFQIYGESSEYVYSIDDLRELLERLIRDISYKQRWETERLRKTKLFYSDFINEKPDLPYDLAAKYIGKLIY